MRTSVLALLLLLLATLPSFASIWNVGSTRTYKMPSEVVDLVQAGDTVLIDAGTYATPPCVWTVDDLSIRGVGEVVTQPSAAGD